MRNTGKPVKPPLIKTLTVNTIPRSWNTWLSNLHFDFSSPNGFFLRVTVMSDIWHIVATSAGVDRLAWPLRCRTQLPAQGVSLPRNPGRGWVDSWVRNSEVGVAGRNQTENRSKSSWTSSHTGPTSPKSACHVSLGSCWINICMHIQRMVLYMGIFMG